jgi:outer membrane protein assembly factor BamA
MLLNGFMMSKTVAQNISATFISDNPAAFSDLKYLLAKEQLPNMYFDTLQLRQSVARIIIRFQNDGYLTASAAINKTNDSVYVVTVTQGNQYRWAALRFQNDKEYLFRLLGIATYIRATVTPEKISALHQKVLHYYENNGYPFVQVYLDSVTISNDKINAAYIIQPGAKVSVDSLSIEGDAKVSKAILYNYISIKPGDLYNEALMQKLNTRIREINFVSAVKPAQVIFSASGCFIKLFLAEKKSSQIDGIIGVMPGPNADDKPIVTGNIRLRLQNSFAHGELFDLQWERPKNLTQILNIKCIYPFLFKTPFGIDAALNIRKQDTTFLNVQGDFGINYFLPGGNYVKFFVQSLNSSLLSTANLQNAVLLPAYADITKQAGGIGFKKEDVDYRYNPRKGYAISLTVNAGIRTIKPHPKINEQLYDSIDLKTTQYETALQCNTYLPLGQRHVINLGMDAAGIFGSMIFENEVFRIGGLQSLRGFDEQSILATQYAIGKFEYRFILDAGSYLQAFFNAAYIQQKNNITDTPYGFGAGLSFETRLGIFSFNYALGKQFDNPLYIRAAKIHFGIINYF